MWDFSTDSEFQSKLDWMRSFVTEECEPLDLLFPYPGAPWDVANAAARSLLRPLQEEVRARGLWACHLGAELGGPGYGQVKLALMNEILGRSNWAPAVFGTAAPDTGNAEVLARFGTEEQKARYLRPLLAGEIVSSFSMTEPHGGSDPTQFRCRALRDGDEWVLDGEKWFSSNARYASFLLVLAVTDPDAARTERMSMFIVPAETPGVEIIRNVCTYSESESEDEGSHAYIRYHQVRVPADHLLGEEGAGFRVAQARLGGGRIHHAMRTVGLCQRAFDMMCERALSRTTQGEVLAAKQAVEAVIAASWIELQQFRLLVLHTAWLIDTRPPGAARTEIAMCKVAMAKVHHDVIERALHLHGSLGTSRELPLAGWWAMAPHMALMDGPTEVHLTSVAKGVLRGRQPAPGLFPTEHIPTRLEAARRRYAGKLAGPVRAPGVNVAGKLT
jgi:acyl-CoA dehydrogenase